MSDSIVSYHPDPTSDTVLRGLDAGMRARKARQDLAVDTAVRQGVGTMLDRGGSAGYQDPGTAPMTPGAGAGGFDFNTAVSPPAAAPMTPKVAAAPPPSTPDLEQQALAPRNQRNNSPGNLMYAGQPGATPDPQGFARFATPEAGLAANDANLAAYGSKHGINTIAGVINRWAPGTAPGNTPQSTANYIQYVSQRSGIDPNAQINLADPNVRNQLLPHMAAWEGGTTGAGGSAPAGGSGGGQTAAAAPGTLPPMMPGASYGMGGSSIYGPPQPAYNARYDPILRSLSQVPGGGAPSLDILKSQSRYDMATGRRQDSYARLAMTAAARGDVPTATYFAQVAGLNVPQGFGQDAAATRRLGTASLMAERLAGGDSRWAAAFTHGYMQTGNVDTAMQMAGQPRDRILTPKMLYDAENDTYRMVGVTRQGQGVTVTGQDGQPITGDRPPTNQVIQTPQGYATVNKNSPTPTATPVMQPGANTQAQPIARGNPAQAQHDALVASGVPDVQAWAIARGQAKASTVTPAQVVSYRRARMGQKSLEGQDVSDQAWNAKIDAEMDALFTPAWRQAAQVAPPGGQAPAAPMAPGASFRRDQPPLPQAPADTSGPAPPAAPAAPAGGQMPPEGSFIRQGGKRYQIRGGQPVEVGAPGTPGPEA